jgi:hypothetical protein
MKAFKHVLLVASIVAIPGLSFAQQMNPPTNDTTAQPTVSRPDASTNPTTGAQYLQPSHGSPAYGDNSGYGAPATGSSQSSTMRFVGKNSRVFDH